MSPATRKKAKSRSARKRPDVEGIIRHSYRGPVDQEADVFLVVEEKRFKVLDIGSRGIGIALQEPEELTVGQKLSMTLHLEGRSFPLEGVVKHVSPDTDGETYQCGIELQRLDRKTEEALQAFVLSARSHLLGGSLR